SSQYASALANADRYAEAEAHLRREVLPLVAEGYGATSAMYGIRVGHLARAVGEQGRSDEAEALYEEAYALLATRLPARNGERAQVAAALGVLQATGGAHGEALPLLQEAVEALARSGVRPEIAARRRYPLGASLLALGRLEEAERHLAG